MLDHHPFYTPPAVSGSNFDEFLESFAPSAPPFFAQPEGVRGDEFQWWSSVVATPEVTLFQMRYTADWSIFPESDEESLHVILLFSGGRLDATIGADEVSAVPQTALLIPTARLRRVTTFNGPQISKANLIFSSAAVARVLSSMFGDVALSALRLAPVFDLTTPAGVTLNWLIHSLASGMVGERVLERSPKAMALLVETTLRFIFENVPHGFSHRLHQKDLITVAPRHVRVAIEYMHMHVHQPITIAEIAKAADSSVRALQMGFRQYCDTTPKAYLRHLRLKAVREELSHPGNSLPVGSVALKWGFTHLGHFAARYRTTFGEHPSDTVRKAQAG